MVRTRLDTHHVDMTMLEPLMPADISIREQRNGAYVDWYGGKRVQSWRTPKELFDRINARFDFDFDGAADEQSALLPDYASADSPQRSWATRKVFCNPPWSQIPPFVELAATASFACLLVPARTNCKWFHRALELGARVEFFRPKPKFVGARHVSPVDCVFLLFGTP